MTKPRWQQLQGMLQFFADLVREKAYLTPYHLDNKNPPERCRRAGILEICTSPFIYKQSRKSANGIP
jgi:hypothetical protein